MLLTVPSHHPCSQAQLLVHVRCSLLRQVALGVSDSVQPHRQQPTRLPRPWDSPGKNTGVGCHFLPQCMKVKSESEGAQSCGLCVFAKWRSGWWEGGGKEGIKEEREGRKGTPREEDGSSAFTSPALLSWASWLTPWGMSVSICKKETMGLLRKIENQRIMISGISIVPAREWQILTQCRSHPGDVIFYPLNPTSLLLGVPYWDSCPRQR